MSVAEIQGTAVDAQGGSGVSYVEVVLYDETARGYYNGSSFPAGTNDRQVFRATMMSSGLWKLPMTATFTKGHRYSAVATAIDASGNRQTISSQSNFMFDGETAAAPVTSTNANTNSAVNPDGSTVPTTDLSALLDKMDALISEVDALSKRPVSTVTTTTTRSSAPTG